jgi:hypothetical protein
MDNSRGWVLVIGILVIVAVAAFSAVWLVYDSVQRTVSPVQEMTGDLGTRVSSVLNPTPTVLPDPATVIHDVRSLSRLETIQFSLEKVITAEAGQGSLEVLFGDKLIFIAHGNVIAGIDLGKLGPKDLELRDGILYVTLPEPEVFITALDNEKSYVYDRDTGLLTKGDINLESTARRVAEDALEEAAQEDGILELARQNAEVFMGRLLRDLGYPEVTFIYEKATPTPGK